MTDDELNDIAARANEVETFNPADFGGVYGADVSPDDQRSNLRAVNRAQSAAKRSESRRRDTIALIIDVKAHRLRCEQLEQRIAVLERESLADVERIREQRELLDAFRERAEAAEKRAEVAEAKLAPAKLALEQAHKTATGRAAEMIYDAIAAIASVTP